MKAPATTSVAICGTLRSAMPRLRMMYRSMDTVSSTAGRCTFTATMSPVDFSTPLYQGLTLVHFSAQRKRFPLDLNMGGI